MRSATSQNHVEVIARVDDDPFFRGTIHDAATARRQGFQGALVQGPLLYGFLATAAVEHWGVDWLERGTMSWRFRRPVYDGQRLVVSRHCGDDERGGVTLKITGEVDGVAAIVSEAVLPHESRTPPSCADFPIDPTPADVVGVTAGALRPDTRLRSSERLLTADLQRDLIAKFGEGRSEYVAAGVAPPGYLLSRVVRDCVTSFVPPTPFVFLSGTVRHFAAAHVGDHLATSGRVLRVFMHNGDHCFSTEQVLLANATKVIARLELTMIYASNKERHA